MCGNAIKNKKKKALGTRTAVLLKWRALLLRLSVPHRDATKDLRLTSTGKYTPTRTHTERVWSNNTVSQMDWVCRTRIWFSLRAHGRALVHKTIMLCMFPVRHTLAVSSSCPLLLYAKMHIGAAHSCTGTPQQPWRACLTQGLGCPGNAYPPLPLFSGHWSPFSSSPGSIRSLWFNCVLKDNPPHLRLAGCLSLMTWTRRWTLLLESSSAFVMARVFLVILASQSFQVIVVPEVFEPILQLFSQGRSIICLNSCCSSEIATLNGYLNQK